MTGATLTPGSGADGLLDRRVLVVEDDLTVREMVVSYLKAAGFCVDEAQDGLVALRIVEAAVPDLVVLDRLLPGVDEIWVARRMQLTGSVPIIMLTALGSTEDQIAGLEAGVDDYLTKPFSARELVLRVQNVRRPTLTEFAPETPFDLGEFRTTRTAATHRRRPDDVDRRQLAQILRTSGLMAGMLMVVKRVVVLGRGAGSFGS